MGLDWGGLHRVSVDWPGQRLRIGGMGFGKRESQLGSGFRLFQFAATLGSFGQMLKWRGCRFPECLIDV
jgi:hypothetical protein